MSSNQNEIDYDKQFRDDLAKATALSLEQQALDEYNRSKRYEKTRAYYEDVQKQHAATVPGAIQQNEMMKQYYAQLRQRQYGRSTSNTADMFSAMERRGTVENITRAASVQPANIITESAATTVALNDSDLISFNSPTNNNAAENESFEKLIEDLQKLQTVTSAQTTAAFNYQTNNTAVRYLPALVASKPYAGNLQLVPFTPPPQPQKVPLTNEELQKLYNMPYAQRYAVPTASPPATPATAYAMGFVAPTMASAAYMPPKYPGHAYKYAGIPIAQQLPNINSGTTTATTTTLALTATNSTQFQKNHSKTANITSGNVRVANAGSDVAAYALANGYGLAARRTSRSNIVGEDLIDLNQYDEYVLFA